MGAYGAIPPMFARVHPRYLTPSVSTLWMGAVSIVFYVGLTLVSNNVLADTIAAVGILIAFYYGMTGFACAWAFRRDLPTPRDVVMRLVFPLLGGLTLLAVFIKACFLYAAPDYGATTFLGVGGVFVVGVGTLVLGALLMAGYNLMAPAYFRGDTLDAARPDLLLEPPADRGRMRLPDSHEETVIAPDLSNLPPGREPYEPSS
jgi:amino acid transporter